MNKIFKSFFGRVGSWLKTTTEFGKVISDEVTTTIMRVASISMYSTFVSGLSLTVWKITRTACNIIYKACAKVYAFAC